MKRIAVLGSGLLGGSVVLAVQSAVPELQVALWGRRQEGIDEALKQGVLEASTDIESVVKGADLIILASPVGAMLQILEAVAKSCSLAGVLITDVGSVKLAPRDTLKSLIKKVGAIYIGSHPMAGSEQAGIAAAAADLFQGAACILTNDFQCEHEKVDALTHFWESIGCQCHVTSSEEHDRALARISHMPHMLASVGALVGLKHPSDGKFAGNGMRDTTRVASGHPGMWAEIFMSNREALKAPIEESINHLREMLALLENSSEEALTGLLNDAKQLRDRL
ncbi:MAG: prephenate dehydrogenase [Akkermansiaceae bacterium]